MARPLLCRWGFHHWTPSVPDYPAVTGVPWSTYCGRPQCRTRLALTMGPFWPPRARRAAERGDS